MPLLEFQLFDNGLVGAFSYENGRRSVEKFLEIYDGINFKQIFV